MSKIKKHQTFLVCFWWSTSKKSLPLIIEEVRRWRDLIWDDYLKYQYQQKCQSEVGDHNILPTTEKP